MKPTRVTNRIRALRFACGEMTQAELAERIGVTRQTVIAIEQGRYSPLSQLPRGDEMRAVAQDRYGPADVLELREVAQPSIGKDQVLIRVRAAGVDPGVWICMTDRPYGARVAFGMTRPRVAVRGRALAGVVVRVGAEAKRFQSGVTALQSVRDAARVRAGQICATPRTGSSLLRGLLDFTGIAGHPESYFRQPDEQKRAVRWVLASRGANQCVVRNRAGPARARARTSLRF